MIGNSRAWALLGLGVFLSIAELSYATTITVINNDGAGEGFKDRSAPDPASTAGGNIGATLGAQRLLAFRFAANLWEAVLQSAVVIKVDAEFNPLFCDAISATLGQAGPNTFHRDFVGAPVAATWYVQALANARSGADLDPTTNDIGAEFNSTFGTTCAPGGWYYGLDGNPPAGTIDFPTVVLHELAHGLGFLSLVDEFTGAKFLGFDDAYMRLIENHATSELFPTMTDAERIAAQTAGPNLHWTGTEAITCGNSALTRGRDAVTGHIEMYAPSPVEQGASVSHFSTSLAPNQLMEPFITEPLLNLNALVDPCLLVDLGWTLLPPPPVSCDGRIATIVGTNGNDHLAGTQGNDVIHGLGGNDIITGLGGNDVMCGGSGRDRLSGNTGRDRLFGGAGRDVLRGGSGNDRLSGQSGNDAMNGQSGFDRCNGGSGRDTAASCDRTTRVP